jgi:hypothetical protein
MAVNTQAILAKFKKNYQASSEARKAGAMAVRESPSAAAARNVNGYLNGVQEAVSSGRFVARCNAVSVQDWQQAYTEKGIRNGDTGVANLSPRAMKNMADQQIYADQVSQEIASMPSGTEQDSINRMMENFIRQKAYGKRA